MDDYHASIFSDLAWQLLGRYIAKNDHLDELILKEISPCVLNDKNISLLFGACSEGTTLRFLGLEGYEGYPESTEIGLAGIQSMLETILISTPNVLGW